MAGSPKKRARREAEERARNTQSSLTVEQPSDKGPCASSILASERPTPVLPAITGDILPPVGTDPTRTALKRAMRQRAQEHAEKAIAVLVASLDGADKKLAHQAANDLLAWGFGKPVTEIEAGDGAQMIIIQRFGDT